MAKKDIFKTLSEVRAKYPEDIARIDEEAKKVKELLLMQNFAEQDGAKVLATMCREQVVTARKKLATDKTLIGNEKAQRDLWLIIESRLWVLEYLVKDYSQEIEDMHGQLLNDLE